MILNIKYKSTIIKKSKQENLVFPFFFPSLYNSDGPSPGEGNTTKCVAIEGNQVLGVGGMRVEAKSLRKMGNQEDVLINLRGKETE